MNLQRLALLVVTAIGLIADAGAADFCVANGSELELALSVSNGNGVSDVIRLQAGEFRRTGSSSFYAGIGAGQALAISGGWSAGCLSQVNNPALSQIHGDGLRRGLAIDAVAGAGAISVSNLSFVAGSATSLQSAAGLAISGLTGYMGDIVVERNIFRSNTSAAPAGALYVVRGASITIRGNLFTSNTGSTAGAVYIDPAGGAGYVTNNTFANNTTPQGSLSNPGALRHDGSGVVHIANNLFIGNSNPLGALDLTILAADSFVNNRYTAIASLPATASGNTMANPQVIDANTNLRLQSTSPMIDAGIAQVPGGAAAFDLDGQPRVAGARIDIGAYEKSDLLFANGYE